MLKSFIFIIKYKILSNPVNLSYHVKEFFKLSKNTQRKVLNKYFDKIEDNFDIESYFNTKEARFYDGEEEVTFFNCYYFDKLILEHNLNNIKLVDKFKIEEEKINYLINYALEIKDEDGIDIKASNLVNYNDELPIRLAKNVRFMKELVDDDYTNIRYLIYNELNPVKQRELIKEAIKIASEKEYNLKLFLKRGNMMPGILVNNLDFFLYLIKNDINNVGYLREKFLNTLTDSEKKEIVRNIVTSISSQEEIEKIEKNLELSLYLNKNESFINCMLKLDINNINYVDWHNLTDKVRNDIINKVTKVLNKSDKEFNIMNYPFREIFFQNYNFMEYLVDKDFRWLAVSLVNGKDENDRLINLFFDKLKVKKYRFKLNDFLVDGEYLNYNLVSNKKMLHYLFSNNVPLVQHIDFFNLKNGRAVVDNLVDELEKTGIDYNFCNDDFLVDGKYPVALSNSYRFMRFVIDKNFNHIAYIDTSMLDKRELKRIINYAFRMVYYIRGKNKNLSFDFDGYFKDSMIINDAYFQECLESL